MTLASPSLNDRPVIRQHAGIWWCSSPGACGLGLTPKIAYDDWKARIKLLRSMFKSDPHEAYKDARLPCGSERHGGFYCEHGST